MSRQRIVILAYRRWAKLAAQQVVSDADSSHWEVDVIDSKDTLGTHITGRAPSMIFAFGWSWKIPQAVIDRCSGPVLIAHPSPLPRYRGGSPIQHQIIAGETVSAVTLFEPTDEMDAGPVYAQRVFSLKGTLDDVLHRISVISAELALSAMRDLRSGSYAVTAQPPGGWETLKRRQPDDAQIAALDIKADEAINRIRSQQLPYPPAYLLSDDGVRIPIQLLPEDSRSKANIAYRGEHL